MDQKKRILVIEDDEDVRYLLGASINEALPNVDVDEFENAENGLAKCQKQKYELVITDFKLPGMDGFDFTKKLGEHPLNANCPIIFISGYFTELEAAKNVQYFENLSFVDKPFETSQLIMHIKMKLFKDELS
ncbi:MAG: response regulator [Oligoflexales bacterium]|nr:response regulator [Oligoflexales bacterium]